MNAETSKIWLPMWACTPTSSRPGRPPIAATASAAAPEASEKPNFVSSCPVLTYSWVCASTPGVTRMSNRVRPCLGTRPAAQRARQPVDLVEGVDHDPADPGRKGGRELLERLVVAVAHELVTARAPGERHGQLATCRHVE